MDIKQVKLIYFSPTGTTQKVLESIAKGITAEDVGHINLTLLKETQQDIPHLSDELVIIGAPVYGGRLPVEAIKRFKKLKADNTPTILIVVYGNREFEDALLELKNLATEIGFHPIAAGAFIGEHSFATEDVLIAKGRPDCLDVQKAVNFGAKIRDKVTALQSPATLTDLKIPGRFPYEGGMRPMTVAPVTEEDACTACGTCAGTCPTSAISVNKVAATKSDLCIRCSACIKKCPVGARSWEDAKMKNIFVWLNENCRARKEPQIFGIDV